MRSIRQVLVVSGGFLANFLECGTDTSFGVLLNYITWDLDVSVAFISLVFGLSQGLICILAPLNTPLIKRFTPRRVCMTYALLATAGFVGASFAMNGAVLAICLLMYGLAYSGIGILEFSCPADYCPDRFDTAISIISTGGGVGMMVLPIVVSNINNLYGWRGTFLLMGAFHFHVVLFGALMKPIIKHKEKTALEEDPAKSGVRNQAYICEEKNGSMGKDIQVETEIIDVRKGTISGNILASSSSHVDDVLAQQSLQQVSLASISDEGLVNVENIYTRSTPDMEDGSGRESIKKRQVPYGRSLAIIPEEGIINDVTWSPTMSHQKICINHTNREPAKSECCHSSPAVGACLREIDICLFRDFPRFFIPMTSCGFLFAFGYTTWTIFLIPNAEAKGISPDTAVYLSTIGAILGIAGRFLSGLIAGREWIRSVIFYSILCLLLGFSLFANFVAKEFWSLGLLAGMSGLFLGGKITLISIIVKDNLPHDRFRPALALVFLTIGAGSTLTGYTIGALYDITRSYDLSYGVGGALEVLSAFVILIALIPKRRADSSTDVREA